MPSPRKKYALWFGAALLAGLALGAVLARRDGAPQPPGETHPPAAIYLAPASSGGELWRLDLDNPGAPPHPLTETGGSVYDFAPAPGGEAIAYTVTNGEGGSDLWLLDVSSGETRRLVRCFRARCYQPDWSPDGIQLAYTHQQPPEDGELGPAYIWTVPIETAEANPIYADPAPQGHSPRWSPDGEWLAFFDTDEQVIRLIDLHTGDGRLLPAALGLMGNWSPDGSQLLFADLQLAESESASRPYQTVIYHYDIASDQITPLLEGIAGELEYGVPAWSADGERLAVGIHDTRAGPGMQVWVMPADGQDPHPATADPAYTYGAYRWEPHGDRLLLQRFPLGVSGALPEVLLWTPGDEQAQLLATDAALPAWLP